MYARNVTCYITFRLRGVSIISMDTWSVLVYVYTYTKILHFWYPSGREMFPASFRSKFRYKISNRIFVSTLLLVSSNNFNFFSTLVGERKKFRLFSLLFPILLSIDIYKPNLTFFVNKDGYNEYAEYGEEYMEYLGEAKQLLSSIQVLKNRCSFQFRSFW